MRSICQGNSAVFHAQCLCAIWITAGFSCPRLFYIMLRQLLDFPHYCHAIGLIQCPSMFSPSSARIRRDLLSQVTGHLSPCSLLLGDISQYGQCMVHLVQNSTSLGNVHLKMASTNIQERIHNCSNFILLMIGKPHLLAIKLRKIEMQGFVLFCVTWSDNVQYFTPTARFVGNSSYTY